MYESLKLLPNNSTVSQKERSRYLNDSMSLTIWYDEKEEIFALELIFDLLLDEWAFIHHRRGTMRYSPLDSGKARIGRHAKQAVLKSFPLPRSRLEEFQQASSELPAKECHYIINALMKCSSQKKF